MTRAGLVAVLSALAAIPAAAMLLGSSPPATGPEPVRYGRDACDRCRMRFSAKGFAGERRDPTGLLHKYDDLGCLLSAAPAGQAWVEVQDGEGFVPLLAATLVKGDGLGTPMNSGVIAFRDQARAAEFARTHSARLVTLEELLRDQQHFGAPAEVHR